MGKPIKSGFLLPVLAVAAVALVLFIGRPQPRAQHVFIISFDQAAPFNIEKADMPVFKSLVAGGAHTWEAYTIVPSLTLPAHTSMLTGVGIQKHQITWNEFEPEKGTLRVPTIFGIAKDHHRVTALVAAKNKFRHLNIPGSLDAFIIPADPSAASIADAFVTQILPLKPNLCFIHFADPDTTGHRFGVESPEKMKALADCDAALQKIQAAIQNAGIADSSILILTADHGGHDLTADEQKKRAARGEGPLVGTHGSAATADVVIPWVAAGPGVKSGFTITAPVVQYDTAATALWLLGIPVPESFWGRPVTSAFR